LYSRLFKLTQTNALSDPPLGAASGCKSVERWMHGKTMIVYLDGITFPANSKEIGHVLSKDTDQMLTDTLDL